ncbi:MAG: hypothetical protein IKP28_06355 [Clostridia bacterium]|nr:hypothetical protein [Clostridia bacterium]
MTPKKIIQLIITNSLIAIANIAVFSNAFLGFSLFAGNALSISVGWFTVIASISSFTYFNKKLLTKVDTYALINQKVNSLDDCVVVFEEAIKNGDVFDDDILKNIDQLKRFKRKVSTIREILQQKFSAQELTNRKFEDVLNKVEEIMYLNMRSILNKIAAFDVDEYEDFQKRGFPKNEISEEKMNIYNEYINFVKNATETNEEILLKLDKMLFEVSRYNTLEDGEIKELPALAEMDELIKNAKLYK